MRFENVLNHRLVTRFGIWLGLHTPPWIGYALAEVAATLICLFKPAMYHAVKGNLRLILGPDVFEQALERKTRALFVHSGRTNYDFFHAVEDDGDEIRRKMAVPATLVAQLRQAEAEKRGVLLLGTHISNFNLGILALGAHGVRIQTLSLQNPNQGFTLLNRLRAKWGIEITPISAQSLRQAIRRLEAGGVVMTAFDYPVTQNSHLIPFFRKPAYFPLGLARLARIPGISVLMGSCHYEPEAGYSLDAEFIEMQRTADRQHDTKVNAHRMAKVLERYVAQYPDQWLMFRPFWPEDPTGPRTLESEDSGESS
jgi:lauroyl/myristoyl acyltransferase